MGWSMVSLSCRQASQRCEPCASRHSLACARIGDEMSKRCCVAHAITASALYSQRRDCVEAQMVQHVMSQPELQAMISFSDSGTPFLHALSQRILIHCFLH